MATFGIFLVKMPDGGTSDFLMYIIRGLEFCKFSHLEDLAVKSSNIDNSNNTPQQTELDNVIQFVNAGPPGNTQGAIFQFDILYSGYQKDLRQIEDCSKNEKRYC